MSSSDDDYQSDESMDYASSYIDLTELSNKEKQIIHKTIQGLNKIIPKKDVIQKILEHEDEEFNKESVSIYMSTLPYAPIYPQKKNLKEVLKLLGMKTSEFLKLLFKICIQTFRRTSFFPICGLPQKSKGKLISSKNDEQN